ncbi:MAG TPA: hypothetical protein VMI31_08490 [Fimbriimonadaceae bacterium]|nr:hypothetical protein [Fimbriimonadaceae bacterium]
MRVLLCKFCEYVCKLENGRHSLIGVFDDVRSSEYPVDHPSFYLAFELEFDQEEMGSKLDVVTKFVAPDNTELLRSELKGEVPKNPELDHLRIFFFAPVKGVRLTSAGNYRIVVTSTGDIVHIENLPVREVKVAPPGSIARPDPSS